MKNGCGPSRGKFKTCKRFLLNCCLFICTEIEIANWLTLPEDIPKPGPGYDAIVCLGNSFAHLPDFDGKQENHRLALRNFASMLKPGGILIIDHRNYDAIIDTGRAPVQNIYYVVRLGVGCFFFIMKYFLLC